jgi:hypothetical protein
MNRREVLDRKNDSQQRDAVQNRQQSPSASGPDPRAALKDLVQRFRVCWQVWPEQTFVGGEKRQIGFALELYGTHEPGTEHVDPGCAHCSRVMAALREIANSILPRETRPSMYELDWGSQSLSYSPARANRPDVTLTIRIMHRHILDNPVDECETRCLREMEQGLRELGACNLHWSTSKTERHRP